MDVVIYQSETGQLLLVPACLLPSHELLAAFGPVRVCGPAQVRDDDGSPAWQRMLSEIDAHHYSVIRREDGVRLLHADAPVRDLFERQDERRG